MFLKSELVAIAALAALATFVNGFTIPDPTATLSAGKVVGTSLPITNQPGNGRFAFAYLAVQFAQNPPLRFAPPSAAPPFKERFLAQTIGHACPQQFVGSPMQNNFTQFVFNNPAPVEGEDCLHLNIFAPPDATPERLKPVMFWIYGGNLQFGSNAVSTYNGTSLAANHDVVVVVINYRTNIFGFPNSPEIPTEQQNAGFLDQRAALVWVYENIAAFGGDPDKITIFGESAGGYSVKQILAQPPKVNYGRLPFRAAILESQAASVTGPSSGNWNLTVSHFGCNGTSSPLACLRKVPFQQIRDFISNQSLSFAPVKGPTFTSDVRPQVITGQFAQVPTLFGTNHDEGRVFVAGMKTVNATNLTEQVFTEFAFTDPDIQREVTNLYPQFAGNDFELASAIFTDLSFTCETSSLSNFLSAQGLSVFRYRFSGVFPNSEVFPDAGAFHASEIPEVFGTYPLQNQLGNATKQQILLSETMGGAWTRFAKDPEAGPGWPPVGTNLGFVVMDFGAANSSTGPVIDINSVDGVCSVYNPILQFAGVGF